MPLKKTVAAFVKSPANSLLSDQNPLRIGLPSPNNPLVWSEVESPTLLSRHGPGKSSVRSVRSATKPNLSDIAELEPTALTAADMDAADRLLGMPEEEETLRIPQLHDADRTPGPVASEGVDYWDQAVDDARGGG